MAIEATEINSDPRYYRAMDPGIVPGSSPGLNDTMALGGKAGHSGWHGPGSVTAVGC